MSTYGTRTVILNCMMITDHLYQFGRFYWLCKNILLKVLHFAINSKLCNSVLSIYWQRWLTYLAAINITIFLGEIKRWL